MSAIQVTAPDDDIELDPRIEALIEKHRARTIERLDEVLPGEGLYHDQMLAVANVWLTAELRAAARRKATS